MDKTTLPSSNGTFNDFPYVRPDISKVSTAFEAHLSEFVHASDVAMQEAALENIVNVRE